MKLKQLAATFALAASAALPAVSAYAADWTVGANIGNVPWEFQDASGKTVGFEVDLINEAARRAGKTVQFENIPFNGLFSAVQSGRINIAVQNTAKYKIASISRYEGLAPAMLDLAAGRIDGYISDIPAVEYYIKDKPQYRIAARIPTGERYSFMFAKNFADGAKLNDVLTAMKKDGFVAKTHQTWFGTMPPADSSSVKVMDVPKL